jgi:hypothetical protein
MSEILTSRLLVEGTPFELFPIENGEPRHFIAVDRRTRQMVEENRKIAEWPTEAEARSWCTTNRQREPQR